MWMIGECPHCGQDADVVEGCCWECGARRGWPVWDGQEPPSDRLHTVRPVDLVDEDLIRTLEEPPL